MTSFKKHDPIIITNGKYKGKHGTFIEVATLLSYRVRIEGEKHTLRRTSIARAPTPPPPPPPQERSKPTVQEVVADIAMIEAALANLKLKVEALISK